VSLQHDFARHLAYVGIISIQISYSPATFTTFSVIHRTGRYYHLCSWGHCKRAMKVMRVIIRTGKSKTILYRGVEEGDRKLACAHCDGCEYWLLPMSWSWTYHAILSSPTRMRERSQFQGRLKCDWCHERKTGGAVPIVPIWACALGPMSQPSKYYFGQGARKPLYENRCIQSNQVLLPLPQSLFVLGVSRSEF